MGWKAAFPVPANREYEAVSIAGVLFVDKAGPAHNRRVLIIGNAGSGKSWLADKLAALTPATHIDLDALHWEPGGFNQRRSPEDAINAVRMAAGQDAWVIEGVFGWLAQEAALQATLLLWLTIPENECVANLQRRPLKSGEDDDSRSALFDWCREYRVRMNANSYLGHEAIYQKFGGYKHMLTSRHDMESLLSAFGATNAPPE